jgi:hypothetical protein
MSLVLSFVFFEFLYRQVDKEKTFVRDDFNWLKENVLLNSQNWRDVEYSRDNNNNKARAVVLGDSYSFGWYIDKLEDTYPKVLERDLNESFNNKFEVINASRHGYSLEEEYERLKHEAVWFHPDLVIVGVNLGEFIDLRIKSQTSYPRFFSKSKLITKFYRIYLGVKEKKKMEENYNRIFKTTTEDFEKLAKPLILMNQIARENQSKLIILIFPELDAAKPNSEYAYYEYHQKLKEFSKDNNILVADPLKLYEQVEDKRGLVLNQYDSHPSVLANKLSAQAIAEQVDFKSFLDSEKKQIEVQNYQIRKTGDTINNLKHVRKISSSSDSKVVFFDTKNALNVQTEAVFIAKMRLGFLEDYLKTVKLFTHDGWPGAAIEYNFEPNGQKLISFPRKLADYFLLGAREIRGFYKVGEGQESERVLPDKISLDKDNLNMEIENINKYFLLKIDFIFDTFQIDIDEDNKVVDASRTTNFSKSENKSRSKKVEFENICEKAGSGAKFFTEVGNFDYAYVNGIMTKVDKPEISNEKIVLSFVSEVGENDVVEYFINCSYEIKPEDRVVTEYE